MSRTGRTLTAGLLALTGAGFLTLSGAGVADAQAAPPACTELTAAIKAWGVTLKADIKKFEADPAAYRAAVDNYGNEIIKIGSQGSPALLSAARTYASDNETEVADNKINLARLNADTDRMATAACVPNGAPSTGGGSSAVLQHPALLGAGAAAAASGFVVVGLTLRRRSRTSADAG